MSSVSNTSAYKAAGINISATVSVSETDSIGEFRAVRSAAEKMLANIPAEIQVMLDTSVAEQQLKTFRNTLKGAVNIQAIGLRVAGQLLEEGVDPELIRSAGGEGGKYARAGLKALEKEKKAQDLAAAKEAERNSFTFVSGSESARVAVTAGGARAKGHGPSWIGGDYATPASVDMEAGTIDKSASYALLAQKHVPTQDESIDLTLKSLARKGLLVAGVVAAAVASHAIGSMIMSSVVRATHGGFSPELAQSAESHQLGMGVLRGFGSIPMIGAAANAMADFQQTQIDWAREASKTVEIVPFESGALRASARGDDPAKVRHMRSAGQRQLQADVDTERAKYKAMYDAPGGPQAKETEKVRMSVGAMEVKLEAYKKESDTVIAIAERKFESTMSGFVSGRISARQAAGIAGMKMSGGNPIDIFSGEQGLNYRTFLQGQTNESAGLKPGMKGYGEMVAKQSEERGNFMAQSRWQAMQFAYSAPDAYVGSAGEAIGQAEISSLRMGQAQQLGNDAVPVLEAILGEMKRLNPTAFGQVQ